MSQLNVGIVGCGRMGRERARCAHASGARIVSVLDSDVERAGALAQQYGSQVISDAKELADCDAVFLCTPPNVRPALALLALRSRVPFFSEKPLGINHAAAEPVVRELTQHPVVNAVGYMNRWRGSIQHAKRTLQGRRVLGMEAHWFTRAYAVPWWLDEHASGGPHNEQATHLFDLARYLCGEISVVTATCTDRHPRRALSVASTLLFESGALGTILYSCEAKAKQIGARVFTEDGVLAFAGWDFTLTENSIDGAVPNGPAEDVFLLETRAFLLAAESGQANDISADWHDAFRTQQAVDAVSAFARG
jgi:myo-inositol 2-dehydrogenase / D-chiro-inositol 1-dehydrogenase